MCGSTDAVSFTAKNGSVVCTTGCGSGRRSTRVMAEPIPLLIAKKATDAKHATFIFLYCRGSTLFVPPTNLRQRQEVLDNFAEQYSDSTMLICTLVHAVDNSFVVPGAGV